MENLGKLKKYFEEKKEVVLAFLFGSQSKGNINKESDFDLAIWVKEGTDQKKIDRIWQELESLLHSNVDLVLLNSARPTVAWSALRGQKLLVRDFKLFLSLFLSVSREAEDMQDFLIDYWRMKKRHTV